MLERFNEEYLLSLKDQDGQQLQLMFHRNDLTQLFSKFSRMEMQRMTERLSAVQPVKRMEVKKL